MKTSQGEAGNLGGRILLVITLSVLVLIWIFPFVIMLLTSLKSQGALFNYGVLAFPKIIHWENYVNAFGHMSLFIRNSVIVTLVKVPVGILVSSLAAYSLTIHKSRGSRALFFFFLVGLGVPFQSALLPVNILLKQMHLLGGLAALFLPYIAFGLPVEILVFRGFFRAIPNELFYAARIDGCSEFGIYWRIVLPLAKSAIAAVFILDSLWTWNEFIMALIFIHDKQWETVPLGLMYFQGQYSTNYPLLFAGVTIAIIPIIIVYLLLQRQFTSGIFGGALKQ